VRKLLNDEAREGPGSVGGENWGTRLSKTTLRSGGGFFTEIPLGQPWPGTYTPWAPTTLPFSAFCGTRTWPFAQKMLHQDVA